MLLPVEQKFTFLFKRTIVAFDHNYRHVCIKLGQSGHVAGIIKTIDLIGICLGKSGHINDGDYVVAFLASLSAVRLARLHTDEHQARSAGETHHFLAA